PGVPLRLTGGQLREGPPPWHIFEALLGHALGNQLFPAKHGIDRDARGITRGPKVEVRVEWPEVRAVGVPARRGCARRGSRLECGRASGETDDYRGHRRDAHQTSHGERLPAPPSSQPAPASAE